MAGFFDYSMQDNAIRIVTEGATKTIPITAMLDQEIRRWLVSEQRKWQVAGNNYYEGRHDILKKKRMAIGQGGQLEEITNLPNSKNIDNQYRKMVKQKTTFAASLFLYVQTMTYIQRRWGSSSIGHFLGSSRILPRIVLTALLAGCM